MRRTFLLLSLAIPLALFVAACGDDDGGTNNQNLNQPDAAVTPDSEVTPDARVSPDASVIPPHACTGDPIAEPGAPGACCNTNADCEDNHCVSGWCTKNCTDDSDCPATAPGPFPTGTQMHCSYTEFGSFARWCVPGSLQACGSPGDADCPTGEVCAVGWHTEATESTDIFQGTCVTAMAYSGVQSAGDHCDDSPAAYPTQCEVPGLFVPGCFARRCSEACDPSAATDTCPTGTYCQDYLALASSSGVLSGIGFCAPATCGDAEFTGDDLADSRIPGADSECASGEHCAFGAISFGIDGDRLLWHCEQDLSEYGAVGDACEHAEKFDLTCDNTIFCIQQQATLDRNGDSCTADEDCAANEVCVDAPIGPNRCSPKPDPGVCSVSCRTDADCPTLQGGPSYCIEQDWDMPNGETGFITYCLPRAMLDLDSFVPCDTNADCNADVGEACAGLNLRSDVHFCAAILPQDSQGADCSLNGVADCQANEACVEDADAGTSLCTPYLAVGETCDATPDACLGACQDIDFDPYDDTAPNNVFCESYCTENADCGANQVCDYRLGAENDPDSRTDDVGALVCRTMMVKAGAGCSVPGDCTNGDACDTTTGRCYTSTADWGDPCTQHSDCPAYGLCNTNVPNGLCYRPGCDPANGNTGCDGTGACSDFLPIGMCLEDCTTTSDCSRSSEGFTCENGACVAP